MSGQGGGSRDLSSPAGPSAGRQPAGRERVVMLALFVIGVLVMMPFKNPVTLTLGVIFLFAYVAFGALVIAGPGASALTGRHDGADGDDPGPREAGHGSTA